VGRALGSLIGQWVPAVPRASRARRGPTEGRFGVHHSAAHWVQRTWRRNRQTPALRQRDSCFSRPARREMSLMLAIPYPKRSRMDLKRPSKDRSDRAERSEGEESFGLLCALPTAHGDRQRSGSCLTPLHANGRLAASGTCGSIFAGGLWDPKRVLVR
jgi:hypothetical protein